jgi:glycosyltransferase involved in cell wall biosynthesis
VEVPFLGAGGRNLDFRRARVEWAQGRMSRLLIERKLRQGTFDVLHIHTQVQAIGCQAIMREIPTVLTMDMASSQVAREATFRYPKTLAPNLKMELDVFEHSSHVVTMSEWARRAVIDDYRCPDNKVTAISPGALLNEFQDLIFEERRIPRLLFVGHDFRRKGGWDVLSVFARHFSDAAELHLVTNESLGTLPRNAFVYPGITAYSDAWHARLRNADIFVMPTYSEAYGLVFQEAAGYGLALIGSRLNAIPEMVEEGASGNGLLIRPGDRAALAEAISFLISDRQRLLSLRMTSRRIALERFDSQKNFRKLADIFLAQSQLAK